MNINKHNIIYDKAYYMDEKEKINIIRQIQDSNIQLCISFSGAGFQFLYDLLKLEGASKCLLNAEIPYSEESLNQNFQINEPFVTRDNTKKLAKISLDKFSKNINNNILISIGCMGSIKTYYEKKGDEKAWIYYMTSDKQEYCYYLKFFKDLKKPLTRELQDEFINIAIMANINDFINNNYKFPSEISDEFQTLKIDSEDVVEMHSNPSNIII
ncbi:MAG: hypothetical protein CL907_06500 [Dehalococcoidia bacterium]|nr:hypothetical protein [Dehalococcoidia bacterium]